MAKRRKLEAPSLDALSQIEDELRRDLPLSRSAAPIAQVAAETAQAFEGRSLAHRTAAAVDSRDAQSWRAAQEAGQVMLQIALDEIEADALVRDRVSLSEEEMEELKASIARSGLRLPIEVFERPNAEGPRYGLLSGYRRLRAVKALGQPHILAVLRDPSAMGGAFAAMVEENEVRAHLSPYERGRIAVVAAQQGAFANTEAAVAGLFGVASKAKRSKIRSFALIFEELGDLLRFPEALSEKDGLRLAAALREGHEKRLRDGLSRLVAVRDPQEEQQLIEGLLAGLVKPTRSPARGGRPKRESGPQLALSGGITLQAQEDARGWSIRLEGARDLSPRDLERLLRAVEESLAAR